MPPASCRRPSGYTSFAPTSPASRCVSNTRSRASSQPGVTIVSLLRNTTYLPRESSAPRLQVPMKPRFCSLRVKRTPVTTDSASETGSGEASSTTMISNWSCRVFSCTLFKQVNVSIGLPYTGMTIDARGASDGENARGVGASCTSNCTSADGLKRSSGTTFERTR